MTALDTAFAATALVAVAGGLLAVTTRHVVHAALWLVVALLGVAGSLLVLGAELVALVLVLVYVGAVVVLLLFAVMLTRAPIGASSDLDRSRWPAFLVGGGSAAALALLLVDAYRWTRVDVDDAPAGTAEQVGTEIFRQWVLPFEVLSVLLLAALVGAIVVSSRRAGSR